MTNTIWSNAIGGDWSNGADWSAGVPTASEDAVVNAKGAYTITISSADVAHSLTMDVAGATLSETAGGSLALKGRLTLDDGTVILNGANDFNGQTRLIGGTLELGNASALGNSGLTIDGGALLGVANISFSNEIDANGTSILAAAHGDTFRFDGQAVFNMNSGGTIKFGQTGDDGTFVWDPLTLGVANSGGGFNVDVNAGTLRDGNGSLSEILGGAAFTTIATGATIDIHGNTETIRDLGGAGTITSTAIGGALTVKVGVFSGTINGVLSLTVGRSLTLAGNSTFSGHTIIDNNAALRLDNAASVTGGVTIGDGATLTLNGDGLVLGSIVDNGIFNIIPPGSGAVVLSNTITGTGSVFFNGGTLAVSGSNSYSGGTTFNGTELIVGNSAALGKGNLIFPHGILLATTTKSISNSLTIASGGSVTFMAAHGQTLTLNASGAQTVDNAASLKFGGSANDGVVVWDSPSGSIGSPGQIVVADGTLRVGDSNIQTLLGSSTVHPSHIQINGAGTFDIAGFASTLYGIQGTGTIENSGAASTVTIASGTFSGKIEGPVTLDIIDANLKGAAANWDTIDLLSLADLGLNGPSSSHIDFAGENAKLKLAVPLQFTGSISGFDGSDSIYFASLGKGDLVATYTGDVSGGTLVVSNGVNSLNITMLGDYTDGAFVIVHPGVRQSPYIAFDANPPAAVVTPPAHAGSFDFSAIASAHIVTDAGIAHLPEGYAPSDRAFAHDVTEAMYAHASPLEHFAHSLFAHGHGFAEALL